MRAGDAERQAAVEAVRKAVAAVRAALVACDEAACSGGDVAKALIRSESCADLALYWLTS